MKKWINGPYFWVFWALVAVVVMITAISWSEARSSKPAPENAAASGTAFPDGDSAVNSKWAKAILSIDNLSCGGCLVNIRAALAPLSGIEEISVDIKAGAADISFDPDKLKNPQQIADAISAAGYPAKIERLMGAKQVQSEQRQNTQHSDKYIAAVGQLKIPRNDLEIELSHARKRYQELYGSSVFDDARGAQVLDQLKTQITSRLISDGIKLQEVERAGHTISSQHVAKEMDAYLSRRQLTEDQFKTNLMNSGYSFDYFKKKFIQRLRVQTYLEKTVLKDSLNAEDRQQRYADWYSSTSTLANVVIYDKTIEDLMKPKGSSGCGGTCCATAKK